MSSAFAALVLVAMGQVQADPAAEARVKAIAPFVDTDVFAVIQVDVARLDVQAFSAKVFGDASSLLLADGKKLALAVVGRSQSRGGQGALLRLQRHRHAGTTDRGRASFATGRRRKGSLGRFMPRRRRSTTRSFRGRRRRWRGCGARRRRPGRSFRRRSAALVQESAAVRLLILPSADSRRVLEELLPRFPEELGGGPITDLTRGLLVGGSRD